MNSATILIADKRGREELVRSLQGRSSDVQCRLADTIRARQTAETPAAAPAAASPKLSSTAWRRWIEMLLPIAVGASLWLFIDSHF